VINKVVATFDEAVADMKDGATLLIGSFGGPADCANYVIAAIARLGVKRLRLVGNHGGRGARFAGVVRNRMSGVMRWPEDNYDPGLLVERGQVDRAIMAFPAAVGNIRTPLELKVESGEIELETVGQGTIAERVRAARAGIAAFYTPTGVGTFVAEGKEVREFDGRQYLLELALKGDYSIIRAHKADRYGNLIYRNSARTFNATMAGASRVTIAEVDEVVELGALDPEMIITPGVYVDRVVVRPPHPVPWDQPG
jgi:3-oxoadipate CoA-transferase alpha subunit